MKISDKIIKEVFTSKAFVWTFSFLIAVLITVVSIRFVDGITEVKHGNTIINRKVQ
ncbi:Uncharacterised protein [Neisseria weaveri]|uniref:Uncharacterized protein n=1 Tax=Neisseria weaveri TaxID=28091 RepID=A0A3S4ZN13_9NEIS|nr:hypothetical protein l11_07870 [Neisseria weaveri LMG 5135]VEJ52121.1 Uncharacterised protein [Neisseria weaveri]